MNPAEFHYNLAEEMIENRWTERSTQGKQEGQPVQYPGYIRNIPPHRNSTNKKSKIKTQYGLKDTKSLSQSRCKLCMAKTTYFCSSCGIYFCHDKSGRLRLDTHFEEKH